jgi:hypothetical protein
VCRSRRKGSAIVGMVLCILLGARDLAAQEQVFRGAITDSVCLGTDSHAAVLTKGESLAGCTLSRVKTNARYVLFGGEGRPVYQLDDQTRPKTFAARNVVVIGTLDKPTNTIHVYDVILALPPKVTQARVVYIDCDACLRGMAKAKQAALEELLDWKRFTLVSDSQKADLIFRFSANKYLGDYITREGPDTRPVHVNITYMNVINPSTGESLWGDYSKSGSWFVARATKDLIVEFRGQVEAEEGQVGRLLLLDRDRSIQAPANVGK